jgi:hypothetical protein
MLQTQLSPPWNLYCNRFYAALDDEQKARLVRDLSLAHLVAFNRQSADRRPEQKRGSPSNESVNSRPTAAPWAGLCQDFTAALRNWPTREIEQGVSLSGTQRIALYELVTASLKAAEALGHHCPAETPITPVRQMAVLRASLNAMRGAIHSIKRSFMGFYEALDQAQRAKFVELR